MNGVRIHVYAFLIVVLSLGPLAGYRRRHGHTRLAVDRSVQQRFKPRSNDNLQRLANYLFGLSYKYLTQAYYFNRSDVALPGAYSYFRRRSYEEYERADEVLSYIIRRGGDVTLKGVTNTKKEKWPSTLAAMSDSMFNERKANDEALRTHQHPGSNNDGHMQHFLETKILDNKLDTIFELGTYITQLTKLSSHKVGQYVFDRYLS